MSKQILRAYKYRLKPDADQRQYLAEAFGCARFVWNKLTENFNSWSPENKPEKLSEKELKEQHEFLNEISSVVLQQKRIDFDSTKSQFFNKNRKVQLGRMKFKKKTGRQSIRFTEQAISKKSDLSVGLIILPKFKSPFKFINHRPFTGELRNVTVSKNPDGTYWISCLVKEQYKPKQRTGHAVGIDLGLKDLLILSNGVKFDHPKQQLERTNRAIKKVQKQLSKKAKGSNNREKVRLRLAKLYAKQTNIKKNYYHEISNYIVTNFDEIFMEDLNVSGMLKNRKLSRVIHEASWSILKSMIQYKSDRNNRNFHQIDRWFPSSKTCSCCGHKIDEMPLSVREWTCPECKTLHDRDLNAAVNILNEGQRNCYGEVVYSSATGEWGAKLPTSLMKHSSKIERSDHVGSVGMGMEQAARSLVVQ
jgi:putative transposase